ncbi:deoxyribose-phosphate aldolase [soil metagenome]
MLMNDKPINQYIEHTSLSPTITDREIDQLISKAREFDFLGICVPPFWVKKASREIGREKIKLVTVIGFPLGYNMTETKIEEMKIAIDNGADELDLVMNISAFKANMPWVKIEIAKCAHLAHQNDCLLKVIIETAFLETEEIFKACQLCQDAGADFVKTSTGFAPSGAQLQHVQLMRKHLSANMGIKASGGIKTMEQVKNFIEAGADRIGTSSGVHIMNSINNKT